MTRHRFDPLSFVFGLVFVLIAVAGLTGPWMLRPVDLAWAGPAVLILLGVVVLASGGPRRDPRPHAHGPAGQSPQEGEPDRGPGGQFPQEDGADHGAGGQSLQEDEPAPGPARPEDG
jgi:hypothetical protein